MSFNLNEGDDDHEFEDVDDAYFSASDGLSSSDRSSEDEHQHRARPSGAGSAAAVAHHVRDTHNVDDIVPTAVVIFRGCESVESRSGAVSTPPVKSDRCDRRGNRGVIPAANTRSACSQPARGMTPSSRAAENHPCKKTSLPQDLDRDASKVFKDRPELHGVGKVRGANGIDVAGARRADGERGSAIFAGISVSDLKFDEVRLARCTDTSPTRASALLQGTQKIRCDVRLRFSSLVENTNLAVHEDESWGPSISWCPSNLARNCSCFLTSYAFATSLRTD